MGDCQDFIVLPENIQSAFRREIQSLDRDLPIFGLQTLEDRLGENYRDNGSLALLFLVFAAIAALLATVGLYAVIAHAVAQRAQEIGIRIAVAQRRAIFSLSLRFCQLFVQVLSGLTIGITAAFAVLPMLRPTLVQVSPTDSLTLAGASGVLILASMLGCLIPARRAVRVDPAIAVRHV